MFLLDVVPDRPIQITPNVEPGTVAAVIGLAVAVIILIIILRRNKR